jgi:formylglycine-generating enzyme
METFGAGAATINRCDTRKSVWISKKKTKTVIQPVTTTTPDKTETLTLTSMMNFKNTADQEPAAAKRGDVLPIRWYQKGTWDKVNVYATLYRDRGDATASSNPVFRTKLSILTGTEGVNTVTLGLPTGSVIGSIPGGGNTDIILHGWARIELESNPLGKTTLTKVSSPAFKIDVVSKEDLQFFADWDAASMIKIGAGSQNPYGFNRSFSIGRTEITNIDFWRTMGRFPDPYVKGLMNAAHGMTYYDAVLYCNVRSIQEGLPEVYSFTGPSFDSYGRCVGLTNLTVNPSKRGYRLPSGNEWIYAYYAGANPQNDKLYFWGNGEDFSTAEKYSWYDGNSAGLGLNREPPVSFKLPNAWGLHDMAGGVFEWTWDPSVSAGVSIRGGSASSSLTPPQLGFNSWPFSVTPVSYRSDTGFRICRTEAVLPPFLLLE